LSGRGLCDELITRPEESYRLCCVVVCDLETSRIGAPYIYDIRSPRVYNLTLILLTWRKWWAPNNANNEQMGFNSTFKGLNCRSYSAAHVCELPKYYYFTGKCCRPHQWRGDKLCRRPCRTYIHTYIHTFSCHKTINFSLTKRGLFSDAIGSSDWSHLA